MKNWSGKSLAERVALFKHKFSYAHCTIYKLRKFYAEYKIRKKKIRFTKGVSHTLVPFMHDEVLDLSDDIRSALT